MRPGPDALAAFRHDIAGLRIHDDPKFVALKSRDYSWYSPILNAELDGLSGDLVVQPATEAEVIRVATACARRRVPLTVRGGGTGNYGQCVPLQGGVILDVTRLDRVLEIGEGWVRVEAGARIQALDEAAAATGQMLNMWPSTRRLATIGGFVSGGSGGIGSLRHGMLRDGGNVLGLRVATVEAAPQVITLDGADIRFVQHAYGTNGVITELTLALSPLTEWIHSVALFDGYDVALRFAMTAQAGGLDAFLLTPVERRFAPYYRRMKDHFPSDRDAVFAMVAEDETGRFAQLAAAFGGRVSLSKSLRAIEAANLSPAYECGWNHTTLQALKQDKGWTYLQVAYPRPFDPDLVLRQMARYGDEMLMHHEMARMDGTVQIFALPLVRWTTKARMYAIIAELEADGCAVYDPHVVTIEEGGMKEIDAAQIAFKRLADPHGLMNPGKTRGWTAAMAET
ncbi:MAG: FAD-binding oxidoreductase [Rhodobacteraceae bacterium]|nr:FAD-binding oxidoreductase [Paracoccaceae bacterium]